jgi:flagellar biosynthesis/type III secretory pathway M-ring protein FliF/YscJ
MKKFRNIPAITTLLAGFIVSVIMIMQHYSLVQFLWILVLVMVAFYAVGVIIRLLLNVTEKKQEEKKKEEEKAAEEEKKEQTTADTTDEKKQDDKANNG